MSSPNVKLDGDVFSDPRYIQLGIAIGSSNYDAIGRMALLWQFCTKRQIDTLPEALVRSVIDPDAVVDADLGVRVEGGIRVRGTKGRIDWFGNLRESGKKGAAKRWTKANPRKRNGVAMAKPSGTDGDPIGIEVDPAVDPSSFSGKGDARGKGKHELPASWTPTPEHAARAAELGVDLVAEARNFRNHAETHARTAVRWNAAFNSWLDKAKAFSQVAGGASRNGTRTAPGGGLTPHQIANLDMSKGLFGDGT